MKSQKNLITSFILGIVYIGVLFIYGFMSPDGTIHGINSFQWLILLALVVSVFIFAVKSLIKKESIVGVVVVILGDFLLFMLSMLLYKGIDRWL